MLERERLIEIVVAVSAVVVLLGAMYSVGISYGGDDGGMAAEGGELLVAVIAGFVVVLTILGAALGYVLNDPEDGLESDPDDPDDAETGSAV